MMQGKTLDNAIKGVWINHNSEALTEFLKDGDFTLVELTENGLTLEKGMSRVAVNWKIVNFIIYPVKNLVNPNIY